VSIGKRFSRRMKHRRGADQMAERDDLKVRRRLACADSQHFVAEELERRMLLSGYTLITLHSFNGDTDGATATGITIDGSGNLYGTTLDGAANDDGTVWELAKNAPHTAIRPPCSVLRVSVTKCRRHTESP